MDGEHYVTQSCVRQGLTGWGVYLVRDNEVIGRVAFYTMKSQAELLRDSYNKVFFKVPDNELEDR